jgi:uncharacterized protein (TIGR02145 family)
MNKHITASLLALFCIAAFAQQKGTFTDTRDGKKYKTVKIGELVWMAENLNYNASGSKCYDNKVSNCEKYGRLYNWATAMGIDKEFNEKKWNGSDVKHQGVCPKGWHIPRLEWSDLEKAIGDEQEMYCDDHDGCEKISTIGNILKSQSGWNSWQDENGKVFSGNGTDDYGFSALPGGSGDGDRFLHVGNYGLWWSTAEATSNYAWYRDINKSNRYFNWTDYDKLYLVSVRCVQD